MEDSVRRYTVDAGAGQGGSSIARPRAPELGGQPGREPDVLDIELLELMPDAFVGIHADGTIALANSQAEVLFGYGHEDLLGAAIELLVPQRFRAAHAGHRRGYLREPRTRPMGAGLELFARRSDGSEFPAEISLTSVDTAEGLLVLAAIRDVSERVTAAEERERLRVEAERERIQRQVQQSHRLEALGQLAGGIAHDFNNVLAVIVNYSAFVAEDLERGGGEDGQERWARTREDLQQIRLAAERAAQLTHQLLAFARREVVQPKVVDVNHVVKDVEALLQRTLGEHIALQSSLAEDLSPVLIDPGKLEQMLVNLAVNARDAMDEGGMLSIDTANVDVDADYAAARQELAPGPHVRLRVSDTGAGMSPAVLERAFDPFFTTKAPGEGTGLGLATVYGIVTQAGGHAQVYSELGVGTTFTALLPASERPLSALEEPEAPQASAGGQTILVVEDEDALREVIQRILTGGGYEVITACDGQQALAVAGAHHGDIDLLLSDVIMPAMPGPQLAERLLAERPGLRVLFMSGFAQPILDSTELLNEDVTLIEKPFAGPALLSKVSEVLRR